MAVSPQSQIPSLKCGKTWYIEYYTELQPGIIKRHRRCKCFDGRDLNRISDLRERERAAEDLRLQILAKVAPPAATLEVTRFVEALNLAVELKRSDKERTIKSYRQAAGWMIDFFRTKRWDQLRCCEITVQHVRAYFDHILVSRKVKNTTFNTRKGMLRALFTELVDRGYLKENFVRQIKARRREDPVRRPLTEEEMRIIRDEVLRTDRAMALAVVLLGLLGIRPGEIRNLRVKAIDFKRGVVSFPASKSKNNRNSVVTIPSKLIPFLESYNLKNVHPELYLFGGGAFGRHNSQLLPGTKRIGENTLSGRFRTLVARLHKEGKLKEIEGIQFYSLKDTLAIFLLDSGIDIETAMRHFRHHSLDMFQRYVKRLGLVSEKIKALEVDWPG